MLAQKSVKVASVPGKPAYSVAGKKAHVYTTAANTALRLTAVLIAYINATIVNA